VKQIAFSIGVLADRFHLPREWIRSQVESGCIPSLRVGRRRIYSIAAVEAALARMAADLPEDPHRSNLEAKKSSSQKSGTERGGLGGVR
jgi:hypothetical protein